MGNLKLRYHKPADFFPQGLPLGNGKMGAMIFGRTDMERICLNEDTLYSGYPKKVDSKDALKNLPNIRKLIFEDDIPAAERLIEAVMPSVNNEGYQCLGNLHLNFGHIEVNDYSRTLDLENAVAKVEYYSSGVLYQREAFVSAVDHVFVLKLSCSEKKALNFTINIDSPAHHQTNATEYNQLVLRGRCPDCNYPQISYDEGKGTEFESIVKVICKNGKVSNSQNSLLIEKADEAIIMISSDTSFVSFDKMPTKDPHPFCVKTINEASGKEYTQLLFAHQKDYKQLFNRCSFSLCNENVGEKSMYERICEYQNGGLDSNLAELAFQYGRYILISSSRRGTEPANLQGIWNEDEKPPFQSAYTMNINLPMNYWIAESTNLSECYEPLLKFIKEISINGSETAKDFYGCNGWTAHHNIDIWRKTAPFVGLKDATRWGMWPMAGVWICMHLWEHYLYTNDISFLKTDAYPVLKGAAQFCLDFLVEWKEYMVTCPSTSPENIFFNDKKEVCAASILTTMDNVLIRELFDICIKCSELLNTDLDFARRLKFAKDRLYPIPIDEKGVLMEWIFPYQEAEKKIHHLSALYGLYPGSTFLKENSSSLFDAAKKHLDMRYAELIEEQGAGWGTAWRICLFARAKDVENTYNNLSVALKCMEYPFRVVKGWDNLLQIDGQMGYSAGIAEMLLQSNSEVLEILPCIPCHWTKGEFKGFCARGGFKVDVSWSDNKAKVCIQSDCDKICKIRLLDHQSINGFLIDNDKIFTIEIKKEKPFIFELNI